MNKAFALSLTAMASLTLFADVSVEFFAPEIVRIVKTRNGEKAVHAFPTVTARPESVDVKVSESGGVKTYETSKLVVKQNLKDETVSFCAPDGTVLLAEKGGAVYHDREWNGVKSVGAEQSWSVPQDEAIYGLGDNQTRELNVRRWRGTLMPRNVGDGVPVWASVKGYAVYWDNTSPVKVHSDDMRIALESDIGNAVDYYFINGGSLDGAVAGIRQISGDVPMMSRWVYGFWQSKERYKTQEETVGVVRKYRELGIPLDGIVQDWQYWGENHLWNAMEFLAPTFGKAKWMIDEVHKMNAKMLITIWQSFGPYTKQYRELEPKGLLFPFETWPTSVLGHIWPPRKDYPSGVRLYDNYSAEARDIYWKHLRRLYDMGIDAWWMDSTDPDHMYKEGDFEHMTSLGCTFREVRSAYPVSGVSAVYDNMRKTTDRRVFILTRGAGLGEQRYAASVWSGDTASTWDVLRRQVPGGLNYTMTGNPNFNCDLGGFFSGRYNRGGGVNNENWRELYVRWMQLGTFMPMMRSHGTDIPREVFLYGKPGESVYDALVGAIKLRYRLMPYIYTVAADASFNRGSFMRPLAADFASDKATWNVANEFLMGGEVLAAPVLKAMYTSEDNKPVGEMEGWDKKGESSGTASTATAVYSAERTHSAYLPAGTDWYCFHSDKRIAGGQKVEYPVTLASQPFFVRAGSILPLGPDVQFNGEKAWDDLEVRVYPGADGSFELYEDDFETYACEKGEFTRIPFAWDDSSRTLAIGARKGSYKGMIERRTFRVRLPDGTVRTVAYDGSATSVSF